MKRAARATWVERVEQWKKSGKRAEEFAKEIDVNVHSLKWWKWMLASEKSKTAAMQRTARSALAKAPSLTPITFVEMSAAIASDAIEVVLPSRVRVAVRPGFDEPTLSRVLEVLERRT